MNLTRIIFLTVCIIGCTTTPKTYKIKMEVYYNTFDLVVEQNILIRRALIRLPIVDVVNKNAGDSIILSFSERNNELTYTKSLTDFSERAGEFQLNSEIVGFSENDSVAFVTLKFFPVIVDKEQYNLLRREKNVTKFIDVYFQHTDGKLVFDHIRFAGIVTRESIIFK